MKYAVVFEQGPSSVGASVLRSARLPVAVGKSLDEARALIAEAIEFHVEGMRLHGVVVPEPSSRAEMLEVA